MSTETKQRMRGVRASRTRKRIHAASLPRLSVFRSSRHIYAQLIDDERGVTVASASDLDLKKGEKAKAHSPQESAAQVGMLIAERCKEQKIERVVFDRGGYQYHGRIKALADGARKGGLKF